MKKLFIFVICLLIVWLFTSCKSSKNIAVPEYSPTELTLEQLQKFALSEGINMEDIIFIDDSSGMVIIAGHITNTNNLKFVVRSNDSFSLSKQSTLEKIAKRAFSDEKRNIIVLVKQ